MDFHGFEKIWALQLWKMMEMVAKRHLKNFWDCILAVLLLRDTCQGCKKFIIQGKKVLFKNLGLWVKYANMSDFSLPK